MFTHVATYEAPYAIANMLDGAELEPDYRTMPRAIFTDPVLAAVGLTETEARAAGYVPSCDRVTFELVGCGDDGLMTPEQVITSLYPVPSYVQYQ